MGQPRDIPIMSEIDEVITEKALIEFVHHSSEDAIHLSYLKSILIGSGLAIKLPI